MAGALPWRFNSPLEANPIQKAKNGRVRSKPEHELGEKIAFQENQTINLAEEPPPGEKVTGCSCQEGAHRAVSFRGRREVRGQGKVACRGGSGVDLGCVRRSCECLPRNSNEKQNERHVPGGSGQCLPTLLD